MRHVDGTCQPVGVDVDGMPIGNFRALHARKDEGSERRSRLPLAVERGAAGSSKWPTQHLVKLSVEFVGDAGCRRSDDLLAGTSNLRKKIGRHGRSFSGPPRQ